MNPNIIGQYFMPKVYFRFIRKTFYKNGAFIFL